MRGYAKRSPELIDKVVSLRAQGLMYKEIAKELGISTSTACSWVTDPDGQKLQARRLSYSGVCVICGGRTDGSNGPSRPAKVCRSCRKWSDDEIIAAIRSWARSHEGIPPTVNDWAHTGAGHPNSRVVVDRLGWNNALLRAGFGLKCDRRPETQAWIEQQLRDGASISSVAAVLGVTPQAIGKRFKTRGTTVSAFLRAAA